VTREHGRAKKHTMLPIVPREGPPLPKPNYAFAKRQRDLAKKQKKEEKRLKKQQERAPPEGTETAPPPPETDKTAE
jgi:hypothetical protein